MDRPFTRPLSTADISTSLADLFKQPHPSNNSEILGLLYHLAETCSKNIGVVHRGITCDGCGTSPIVGTRYHCSECVDVDLCQYCVVLRKHQWSHVLIKIKIPAPLKYSPQWICESWAGCDNDAITRDKEEKRENGVAENHDIEAHVFNEPPEDDLSDTEKHTISAQTGIEPNAVQKAWRKFFVLCDEKTEPQELRSSSFFISHSKLVAMYTIIEGAGIDSTQRNIVQLYNLSGHPSRISFVDFFTVEHWMDSTAPHCELDLVAGFFDLRFEEGARKRVSRMALLNSLMKLFNTIITQQIWWGANSELRDMEEIVTGPGPVSSKFQEYNDFIRQRYFERKPFSKEPVPHADMSRQYLEPPIQASNRSMENMHRDTPSEALRAHFGGHYTLLQEMIGMTCGTELMNPLLKVLKTRGVIDRKSRVIRDDIHILAGDQEAMLLISRLASLIRKLRG
ncbi:E3 ubiquitin-protein ligase HERC2 [Yarrowia sp. B02]|nr:E3 ubiquitin-protein ligase HERC2 [Yarrowia sp. B02]